MFDFQNGNSTQNTLCSELNFITFYRNNTFSGFGVHIFRKLLQLKKKKKKRPKQNFSHHFLLSFIGLALLWSKRGPSVFSVPERHHLLPGSPHLWLVVQRPLQQHRPAVRPQRAALQVHPPHEAVLPRGLLGARSWRIPHAEVLRVGVEAEARQWDRSVREPWHHHGASPIKWSEW